MKTSFSVKLLAALVLIPNVTLAGRYELIKGKGVEVCEVYWKNLNAEELHEPFLCERPIHPEFKEFVVPEWEELDIQSNKRLLWNAHGVFSPTIVAQTHAVNNEEDASRALEKWINLRSQELYRAQLDIDNDGYTENVLMYKDAVCGRVQFAYATALLVQKGNMPEIDQRKTELLLQNVWRDSKTGEVKRNVAYYLYNTYGVFFYKGVTYFDKVSAKPDERNRLSVYQISKVQVNNVCAYRFVGH